MGCWQLLALRVSCELSWAGTRHLVHCLSWEPIMALAGHVLRHYSSVTFPACSVVSRTQLQGVRCPSYNTLGHLSLVSKRAPSLHPSSLSAPSKWGGEEGSYRKTGLSEASQGGGRDGVGSAQ
jgi:hypothetical protein